MALRQADPWQAALAVLLLAGCTGQQAGTDSAEAVDSGLVEGSTSVWGDVYDGADPTVPFLPDQNVRYWRYAFEEPASGTAIRIRGPLLGTRYQAFDVYDDTTRTSTGALREVELDDPATVLLARESAVEDGLIEGVDGVAMALPDDLASVFLRLYDPEGVAPEAELPVVDLVDIETGASLDAPEPRPPLDLPQSLIDAFLERLAIEQREDRVDFYRVDASGLYAADDNLYLAAQIIREPDEVVLVRLQPPTRASSPGDPADVRYWSLTQCDRHSYCHQTLADLEVDGDAGGVVQSGPVEVVIGDEDEALREAAGDRSFVPWSTSDDELLLIYRNLVTAEDFEGSIATIPPFDFDLPAEGQEAQATIGDYAPRGVRCAREAFLSGDCSL